MKHKAILVFLLLFIFTQGLTQAQEETELRLTLSRDFGTSLGSRIRGTFSFRVSGPPELHRVEFQIDGEPVGEDNESPFRKQFRTESYETGIHTLSALGYLEDGRELRSNEIRRDFMSGNQSGQMTALLVGSILLLVVGGRWLSSRIAGRGQSKSGSPAISGTLGGAICPNCGRPFALHLWGFNIMFGRLERCPHCGKWRIVRRASQQALETAAEMFNEKEAAAPQSPEQDDDDQLRRQIDDSRFDDSP